MRAMTDEEHEKFKSFNEKLAVLRKIDPLNQINDKSPQSLQFLVFHLTFEYMVEKWINFKINNGADLFKGIEKIGFHAKIYLAKNSGFSTDIFQCLNTVNDIRNKFAHQIFKSELDIGEQGKLIELVEKLDSRVEWKNEVNKRGANFSANQGTQTAGSLALLNLIFEKVHFFIFTDIHQHYSRPL